MSRTLKLMLIASFMFCCFYITGTYLVALFATPRETTVIVVQENDTLWEIAERQVPGEDARKIVHEIKELNNLSDATIYQGQELIVPETDSRLMGMKSGAGESSPVAAE